MTASDFRRIARSLPGVEEGTHVGAADFRVGGHIFATLAHEKKGVGKLMLSPELQAAFVAEAPEVFLRGSGAWGNSGATHVRLDVASEDVLHGALLAACQLRAEKNTTARKSKSGRLTS